MPFWGWVLLIAGLSALTVASLLAIVRTTHRLPKREPLHGEVTDIAAPVPLDLAATGMTEREVEAEREREQAPFSPDR